MKTITYDQLTEREQGKQWQQEISFILQGAFLLHMKDFQMAYDELFMDDYPQEVIPYILYRNNVDFRSAINARALNCIRHKKYLPLPRNLDATIIYREEV